MYASDFFVTMILPHLFRNDRCSRFSSLLWFLKAASWPLHAGVVKASIYTWNNPECCHSSKELGLTLWVSEQLNHTALASSLPPAARKGTEAPPTQSTISKSLCQVSCSFSNDVLEVLHVCVFIIGITFNDQPTTETAGFVIHFDVSALKIVVKNYSHPLMVFFFREDSHGEFSEFRFSEKELLLSYARNICFSNPKNKDCSNWGIQFCQTFLII